MSKPDQGAADAQKMTACAQGGNADWLARALAVFLVVVGVAIALGGVRLAQLGGSLYYLLGGSAVAVAGVCLWRGKALGGWIFGGFLLVTIVWSLWEAGLSGWPLSSRLIGPAVVGLAFLLPSVHRVLGCSAKFAAGAASLAFFVNLCAALTPLKLPEPTAPANAAIAAAPIDAASNDWGVFGGTNFGQRFSQLNQITKDNVAGLKPAWTYHTGVVQVGAKSPLQATPIAIGGNLYLCTQTNVIISLDPETGKERWRFDPKVDPTGASAVTTCRGVAFHRDASAKECPEKILAATFDARLLAVDAKTGQLCSSFGDHGVVNLKEGLGDVISGFYYMSSAPLVVSDKIVINGWVADNQSTNEPSGVIRAFDVASGKLAWAWDAGNPANSKGPPPGQTYTRSTPNSWAPMSADADLGLIYVPTGNPAPDHFGAMRSEASERFGSALVALDIQTGQMRWSFQTAHHDLWDYDVASQPTLVDLDGPNGKVPAVLQATKRGELFLLDRRTGAPLAQVEERPAPQRGAAPEERLAKTQPFSVGMPSFTGPDLTERDMWGLTPIDQLWCRIRFKQLRYDGKVTPPGTDEALIYPSIGGGMNWGGVAVDPERKLALVNSLYYGTIVQLVPRKITDDLIAKHKGEMHNFSIPQPQFGTPYGAKLTGLVSPLNVPCNAPPYGRIAAVDLTTKKILWSRPFGTAQDSGPFGLSLGLPVAMGQPNFGGALATRSGLTFIGAVREKSFRAFDTETGKELWSARLPASANANPMTYVSAQSGRQFVVVAAGGHMMLQSPLSDTFVAFALPETK